MKTSVLRMAFIGQSGEASHSSLVPPSVAMLPLTLKLNAGVGKDAAGDFPPSHTGCGRNPPPDIKVQDFIIALQAERRRKALRCHSTTGV